MCRSLLAFSFICSTSLLLSISIDSAQKRVKDHLLIKDYTTALMEAKLYLAEHPHSKELQALMIRSLSESGQGLEAFKQWQHAVSCYPEMKEDYMLIEGIAWAILEKAAFSSQFVVNIASIVGASLTNDAKAVKILHYYLKSSNAYLRMMAVQTSMRYGDKKLIQEIQGMLSKESVWYVRLAIMKALGAFHLQESASLLKETLASKKTTLEEKAVAAEALVYLYEDLSEEELRSLIQSKRAGLRYFGCEIISYLNLKKQMPLLLELLDDTNVEVTIAALNAMTVVGIDDSCKEKTIAALEKLASSSYPYVSMTACRLLMFYKPDIAAPILKKWVNSEEIEIRCNAAVAIALSGESGYHLGFQILENSHDPFVKVNLAYSLLGQQRQIPSLCQCIDDFVILQEGKVMIDHSKNPLFKVIVPSKVRHTPEFSQYPMAIDQHTRLHLLNILAMMRYPGAEAAIRKYLRTQHLGATYAASASLLGEGSEDSIVIIRSLLKDEEDIIRVQAALALAFIGGDKEALEVLKNAYPKVDRDLKIEILEALGHIGSKDTIAFLMDLLDDPFNMMRVIAASTIIQCIYN